MKPEIREIDYGLGYTVQDKDKRWIELNRNLRDYPKLYKSVLAHEMKHFRSKNKHMDFLIDFKDSFNLKDSWDIFNFTLHHPKALLSFSPVFYENRRWSTNWFAMIMVFSIIGLIVGGIILI